ncbi:MAG: HEAT repeat domain-containing protein [Gemmatimonadota bacterium]
MRSLLLVLAAALFTAAAVPAAAQQKPAREPVFDGRPLSAWLADLQSRPPSVRNAAAYAISSMGPAAASATPALIAALDDTTPNTVRYAVLVALREIGPGARAALPRLEQLLDDRNDDIVHAAKKAIRSIKGEHATP